MFLVVTLPGCGDDSAAPPAAPTEVAAPSPAAPVAPAEKPTDEIKATVDASGRKWLTPDVPYDVFPGLPSDAEIAAAASDTAPAPSEGTPDGTMVASTDRAAADVPEATPALLAEPATTPGSDAPAPATSDWSAVLPIEALQNEIAAMRNDLGEKLLTVGSYNDAFEQVAIDGWVMSALATIAAEHPAPISWKENALLARDTAAAVAMAATGRGRQNFNDVRLASEQLTAILNNNTPAGLSSPDPSASREETADRAALMTRMQAAFDRLKEAGADEAALKQNLDDAAHEARILAALAKFTSHPDYGSAEEPEYQVAAGEIVASGSAMAEAAGAEDHAAFTAALDRVGTACNQCHQKYRFAN